MNDENLPVPFDEKIHRPVAVGYRRARLGDVTADLVGDLAGKLVAGALRQFFR